MACVFSLSAPEFDPMPGPCPEPSVAMVYHHQPRGGRGMGVVLPRELAATRQGLRHYTACVQYELGERGMTTRSYLGV